MLWRHGDVLIAAVDALPENAKRHISQVLAYGEVTNHAHRLEEPTTAELWQTPDGLFLRVIDVARIIHEEHQPITLPSGVYRVWQQREYTPEAIRNVRD